MTIWNVGEIGPILSREEIFADMQCNLKSLDYFCVLQDMETLNFSHTCIFGICP